MSMMLGEPHRGNPTVHVPPWAMMMNDSTAEIDYDYDYDYGYSPYSMQEALNALQHYVPSNETTDDGDLDSEYHESVVDVFSSDHFRMFEFKVRRCGRGRSHDWTECPYAHPGEKARRRDPRKYHYSGTACPDFRKGSCKKGDACEFAHGVFECWLHPARYRTQPCKDGTSCRRRVCFFAHTPEQRRILPQHSPRSAANSADSYDGSPLRLAIESCGKTLPFISSPAEISPPVTPTAESLGSGSMDVNEIVASLRNMQLGKMKSLPSSWNVQMGLGSPLFGSTRGPVTRPGFCSLPTTPTQPPTSRRGLNCFDVWDQRCEEEPVMERVESGRDIRVKMFEKLSKENSLDGSDSGHMDGYPNVGGFGIW